MPEGTIVIGVVPARYASQRLLAKPLVDLFGKTLVRRVYEQAIQAKLLDQVIVATDDDRIVAEVESFGGLSIKTSPEIRSGSDRVAAVAKLIEGDIFLNIQGDEPLMNPKMIDEGVKLLLDDRSVEVGTLAKRIKNPDEIGNPNVVKVVLDQNRYALYFSRAPIPFNRDNADHNEWLKSQPYYKHLGLYSFRKRFLEKYESMDDSILEQTEKLEQLRILEHGFRIKVGITEFDSTPIDTQADVDKVLNILRFQEGK